MHARSGLVVALASAVALTACGGSGTRRETPVDQRVSLATAASCEQLEARIEDAAVAEMRARVEQTRRWSRGDGTGNPPPSAEPGAPTGGGAEVPSDFTTTNVQVAGVDEGDLVKNDATRLFVLDRSTLHLLRSWPAAELAERSRFAVEGEGVELILDGDRLAIVSQRGGGWWGPPVGMPVGDGMPTLTAAPREGADVCPMDGCGRWGEPAETQVTLLDVTDLGAPRVLGAVVLPGRPAGTRAVDGVMRLVLGESFRWPVELRGWPDGSTTDAAWDALIAENERLIRGRTLTDWFPQARLVGPDGAETALPLDCAAIWYATTPEPLGALTLATIPLRGEAPTVERTVVSGEPGIIYATAERLYVAATRWSFGGGDEGARTHLHVFDLSDPARASYAGSGAVPGTVLNSFSLDEHAGHLRVASTLDGAAGAPPRSRVTVLALRDGALAEVGRTADFAPGERIMSARFAGDTGYVVTFRQIDPLFTIDLSDPAAPRKVGEVEVPGFSSYVHPLDAGHLLTIGTWLDPAPPPGGFGGSALQLAIFDVTDLASPRQTFVEKIGGPSAWSEAQHDHRAFNFWAERGVLAIPFAWYPWGPATASNETTCGSELRLWSVDAAAGLTARGALPMGDLASNPWGGCGGGSMRSVMADDFVYGVTASGVRVARLDAPGSPLRTVTLTPLER